MLDAFSKQPAETFPVELDFSDTAPAGATMTISSLTARLETSGADTTSTVLRASPAPSVPTGTAKAVWWVQQGVAGERHKWTVRVAFSTGEVFEEDVLMTVRDP